LTLVIPADIIYQSVRSTNAPTNIPNVFIIAGAYLLTIVISLFIWASRIYTNRVVLKEIPKAYIPVDKGEVPRKVHRMIVKQWERSAVVAWDSRPRDIREELAKAQEQDQTTLPKSVKARTVIQPDKANAAWGYISHPGWSSPASNDLPNLEYWRVFIELPNLIEAKAVSLAPPDPTYLQMTTLSPSAGSIPDARIVALLQRPSTCGLREYLERLTSFGLINPKELCDTFVSQYENARFSTSSLTESDFAALMATFSSLLTGMTGLDPAFLAPELGSSQPSTTSLTSSLNSTASQIHHRLSTFSSSGPTRPSSRFTHVRSSSTGTVRTAPSRAFSRSIYHTPSNASLASEPGTLSRTHSEISQLHELAPSPSRSSMRSVIRLNPAPGPGQLPYYIDYSGD
jgi:hypothetical protein